MDRLITYLKTWITHGIEDKSDFRNVLTYSTFNIFTLTGFGFGLLGFFLTFAFTPYNYMFAAITLPICLLFLGIFFAKKSPRTLLLFSMNVSVYSLGEVSGFHVGFSIVFLIYAVLPFFFYFAHEARRRNSMIGFPILLYILFLSHVQFFGIVVPLNIIPPFFFSYIPTTTFIIGFVSISYFIHGYNKWGIQIREQTSLLEEAQQIAKLGNWTYRLDTKEWNWSKELYDLFNFPSELAVTTDEYYGRIDPRDRLHVKDSLEKVLKNPEKLRLIHRYYNTHDYQERYLLSICYPITDDKGVPYMIRGIMQDITEQQQAEVALREAKEAAEAATKAKSDFLSTMSHEIRTPLNAVIGMTGLLTETRLNNKQEEFVNTIKIGGENLLSVINEILDYSKIESGNLELETFEFLIQDPVEDAVELLATKAHRKGLEILSMVRPEVPSVVRGDLTRIRQILVNLIGNAIKFTEKGQVLISVEYLSEKDGRHQIQFSVEDTGIGIPADKIDRLFRSFSQVDSSTTRKYGGTGLGLVICKRLIELMDGTIKVSSEVGVGTTFSFDIWIEQGDQDLLVANDLTDIDYQDKIVLLVDDNATNLRILEMQCESFKLKTISTQSPFEAYQWIEEGKHFDLAIIDMQMPEMTGTQLAARIRAIKDKTEFPMVMLASAVDDSESGREYFNAFLTKPCKKNTIKRAIQSVMDGPQSLRQAQPVAEPVSTSQDKLKILVVEDHSINQLVILSILERLGYTADLAANGLEAVEQMNMIQYDLILMDVQMPEMDGLEATREIRKLQDEKSLEQPTIIALTAGALVEERKKCLDAGMDDFLAKPVRVETLASTITHWFSEAALPSLESL